MNDFDDNLSVDVFLVCKKVSPIMYANIVAKIIVIWIATSYDWKEKFPMLLSSFWDDMIGNQKKANKNTGSLRCRVRAASCGDHGLCKLLV